MAINVKEIADIGWEKTWFGEFSIFCCCYTGEFYFKPSVDVVGEGLHHVLFAQKEGITTCYVGKSEMTKFGEFLAEKAVADNEFLINLAIRLKKETDNMMRLMEESAESNIDKEKFKMFIESLAIYQPFQVATKAVVNYLPPELGDKYFPILEEARKYSEKVYDDIEKYLRKIAELIGEKEGYEPKLILSMYKDEFSDYLETKKLPEKEILEDRYRLSGLFYEEGNRHNIGKEIEEIEDEIAKSSGLVTGKVTGKSAFPGLARGICRIIKSPFDYEVFDEGDILVTCMTRPDFIPLMEKAAAFVTDAGGVLSHAAIVSREMKKPCVVGTETATKAFKDGDLIEVDGEKGIVTKIS